MPSLDRRFPVPVFLFTVTTECYLIKCIGYFIMLDCQTRNEQQWKIYILIPLPQCSSPPSFSNLQISLSFQTVYSHLQNYSLRRYGRCVFHNEIGVYSHLSESNAFSIPYRNVNSINLLTCISLCCYYQPFIAALFALLLVFKTYMFSAIYTNNKILPTTATSSNDFLVFKREL